MVSVVPEIGCQKRFLLIMDTSTETSWRSGSVSFYVVEQCKLTNVYKFRFGAGEAEMGLTPSSIKLLSYFSKRLLAIQLCC